MSDLEAQLDSAQAKNTSAADSADSSAGRRIFGNEFNPSIGIILNGAFSRFSAEESEFAGFGVGEEGERGSEGFALGESELNFSANIDDKFYGSLTAAVVREDGADIIELEEAYMKTLANAGLPNGLSVKAGRAFWTLGYLNEHHSHADDFADRPLPYRVFLNSNYNDDGLEATYVLPFDFYSEIGGGMFRGDDYPFGGADGEGVDAFSAFARIGGDIGNNQSWRLGASMLSGEAGERGANEDSLTFTGDQDLYIADARYTWAPTGNSQQQEVLLQAEYFMRDEDGAYEDTQANSGLVNFDDQASGWYVQGVYKFLPQWRVGARYSLLEPADVPAGLAGSALDANGFEPETYGLMVDWTNSEFSRIRLQFNREELASDQQDNQVVLQYIVSLGAHAAHKY